MKDLYEMESSHPGESIEDFEKRSNTMAGAIDVIEIANNRIPEAVRL